MDLSLERGTVMNEEVSIWVVSHLPGAVSVRRGEERYSNLPFSRKGDLSYVRRFLLLHGEPDDLVVFDNSEPVRLQIWRVSEDDDQ